MVGGAGSGAGWGEVSHGDGSTDLSARRLTVSHTFSRDSSFQISSGFSCVSAGQHDHMKLAVTDTSVHHLSTVPHPPPHSLSNMCKLVSGLSFIASMKMTGRNLDSMIRTFGPTSLSVIILPNREAVSSRTEGSVELQNRFSK